MKNTKFKKKSTNRKLLEFCLSFFDFKYIVFYCSLTVLNYVVEDLSLLKTTEYLNFVVGGLTIFMLGMILLTVIEFIICCFEDLHIKKKVEVEKNENK